MYVYYPVIKLRALFHKNKVKFKFYCCFIACPHPLEITEIENIFYILKIITKYDVKITSFDLPEVYVLWNKKDLICYRYINLTFLRPGLVDTRDVIPTRFSYFFVLYDSRKKYVTPLNWKTNTIKFCYNCFNELFKNINAFFVKC